MRCNRSHTSEIHPGDSVSQCGRNSAVSVSSSVRAKAKRAALAAEVEALKELQELQLAELKLKQQKDALMLKTRLKAAEAEERVPREAGIRPQGSRVEHPEPHGSRVEHLESGVRPQLSKNVQCRIWC